MGFGGDGVAAAEFRPLATFFGAEDGLEEVPPEPELERTAEVGVFAGTAGDKPATGRV